jgi:hypothetical protein
MKNALADHPDFQHLAQDQWSPKGKNRNVLASIEQPPGSAQRRIP